jgi:acyl-CoA thioester hydrolase
MPEAFVQDYRARWADMDFNQHMRNAAYLAWSEETRMRFLDAHGWSMTEFMRRRLGPVVVEDRLTYRTELRLLEPFQVDLVLAAISDDARKMRVRNHFRKTADGTLCAEVESVVLWFDLSARKPVAPPPELRDLWLSVVRTTDFARL